MTIVLASPARAGDFYSWLHELRQEAVQTGISEKLVWEALPDSLVPNAQIIRLDRKQPEGTITFEKYKSNVVTRGRMKEGSRLMLRHQGLLTDVSDTYGVDPQYIVALWGVETSFGKNTGGFETIPALVTLAYDGRRGSFFRQELIKALRIIDQGHIHLHEMKGSWAGAMGQCQFMPTSFEDFAQDYNGDGRQDIWRTEADIFASAAAYLAAGGWRYGQPWGYPAELPKNFDNSMIGSKIQKPLKFWQDAGVRTSGGRELPFDADEVVSIIQPGGKGYKTYAVGNNYRILLKWNASIYFATAVGLLADGLKG